MRKHNLKTILITCMVLIFLTGCIDLSPKKTTTTSSSLYKGIQGLEVSFVKNAPPSSVFANAPFKVIVNIKNKGAYDILTTSTGDFDPAQKGIFVLIPEGGYVDFKEMDKSEGVLPGDTSAFFEVRGKSLSNDVGDEVRIHSTLTARDLSSLSAVHASSIFATVCYPYQTKVSTSVCIDSDIYDLGPVKKACDGKDLSFSGGQGAPVAVTKVEVRMSPEGESVKPQFLIYVENKGDGEVVEKDGYVEACNSGIPSETNQLYKYFNVVNIEAKLSGDKLDCRQGDNEGIVILDGKKGIIKCSSGEIDTKNAYVAPLSIVLDYGYTRTISKSFNIEKAG